MQAREQNLVIPDLIILCGGQGTRLQAQFPNTPKLLVPIHGRPLLFHLIKSWRGKGVRRFVFAVGHLGELIQAEAASLKENFSDCEFIFSIEKTPLGTGGALKLALEKISGVIALAINGDSFCDLEIQDLLAWHIESGKKISMVCSQVSLSESYGSVEFGEAGEVTSFSEKQDNRENSWVNAGVYVLSSNLLKGHSEQKFSLETEFFPKFLGEISVYKTTNVFWDIGTPERYSLALRGMFGG